MATIKISGSFGPSDAPAWRCRGSDSRILDLIVVNLETVLADTRARIWLKQFERDITAAAAARAAQAKRKGNRHV